MSAAEQYINSLFSLTDRVGLVTGASRGIGAAIAWVLANSGATVYNFSRHECADEELQHENIKSIAVDLHDSHSMQQGLDLLIKQEGRLDFLINNAGISYKARAEDFPPEKFEEIGQIDLNAAFFMSKLCFPYLKQSPHIGRIISVSSMGGYLGFSGVVPYCMMKSGILGLTRGLAEEWKNDNILVNSIAPGWFLTKLNEKMFEEQPQRKEAALNRMMLKRFGDPKEIGYLTLFLLSKASCFITGQDFPVDGGALAHGY